MPPLARIGVPCAVVLGLLATSAPAAAATQKRISGKLSRPGYTVLALAANGNAKVARTRRGRFALRPPARRVTLHLRAADGSYAGPIVIARRKRGRTAILGVRAGAKLGRITVSRRRGYARVRRSVRRKSLDTKRRARARRGVPIGARLFGRVRSRGVRSPAPGDSDLDGIPDRLDIDDDGDRLLDDFEGPGASRAAQAGEIFDVLTGLSLPLENTANANAGTATTAQIDAGLSRFGRVILRILSGDSPPELDCGALVYCSRGGTGTIQPGGGGSPMLEFPECCDADGDGFGLLAEDPSDPKPVPFLMLSHGARSDQIGTGDLLIERVLRGGAETLIPTNLRFVFATVPALVSYADTAGNGATVTYPVPAPGAGGVPGGGGLGTQGNGFPVAAGPGASMVLTLTFWPPQRKPIPPETGQWIDIGGLKYDTVIQHLGPLPGGRTIQQPCPQSSYSVPAGQRLAPSGPAAPGLVDQRGDRRANAGDRFTYTLDLSDCLSKLGASWAPGEEASVHFGSNVRTPGVGAGASQSVWLKRK